MPSERRTLSPIQPNCESRNFACILRVRVRTGQAFYLSNSPDIFIYRQSILKYRLEEKNEIPEKVDRDIS
jgi:hypothetical protein